MSELAAAEKRRLRRVPEHFRKRGAQSCDRCRKRRSKCVPSSSGTGCVSCLQHNVECLFMTPRKTRFYGTVDDLSDRYQCLQAIVKGAFPNDDTGTVTELLQLGKRMGYTMPRVGNDVQSNVQHKDVFQESSGAATPMGPLKLGEGSTGNADGRESGKSHANDLQDASRSRTWPGGEESHVSLIRDRSGNEHYIGPSGTLNFLSQLRKLVEAEVATSTASTQASDAVGAAKFSQDDTAQALEADEEHHGKEDEEESTAAPEAADVPFEVASQATQPQDTLSPGSVISAIARDFTRLPTADMDEILQQIPPDDAMEMLIHSYFKHVHGDFPLFHRATFEDEYELFIIQARRRSRGVQQPKHVPDWGWIGCLHMILVFGSISNPSILGIDHTSLRRNSVTAARMLLPQFISKCTLTNVRALLLLSLFLHNNNERNAAWNLVGTATRVSFALGLHRSSMLSSFRPLERELRKLVFCTLYSFEQFLASSLGRPSGLQELDVEITPPREGFLDGGNGNDALLVSMSLQLNEILSRTRLMHIGNTKAKTSETGISPPAVADILASLASWKKNIGGQPGFDLPWIKTSDVLPIESPTMGLEELKVSLGWKTRAQLRAVLLLHIQYHYIAIVATRPVLLWNVAMLHNGEILPPTVKATMTQQAEDCIKNACQLAHLMVLLDSFDIINGLSGLDVFYGYCAAMVLILRLLRTESRPEGGSRGDMATGEKRLQEAIRTLVSKVQDVINRADKGGSMRRFARVVDTFFEVVNKPKSRLRSLNNDHDQSTQPQQPSSHGHMLQYQQQPFYHQSMPLSGAQGQAMETDMVNEQMHMQRFGDNAVGDSWLDFLPLSTFGGSGDAEGMFMQCDGSDEAMPYDWMDMQILLGGYGVSG